MGLHSQLPIYKVAYDLLGVVTDATRNMPRDYKATIGAQIRSECVELTVLIFRANTSRDKTSHLERSLERLQVVELLLRLARDKRLISTGQYAQTIRLTDSLGKQANGWRKSYAASPVA